MRKGSFWIESSLYDLSNKKLQNCTDFPNGLVLMWPTISVEADSGRVRTRDQCLFMYPNRLSLRFNHRSIDANKQQLCFSSAHTKWNKSDFNQPLTNDQHGQRAKMMLLLVICIGSIKLNPFLSLFAQFSVCFSGFEDQKSHRIGLWFGRALWLKSFFPSSHERSPCAKGQARADHCLS